MLTWLTELLQCFHKSSQKDYQAHAVTEATIYRVWMQSLKAFIPSFCRTSKDTTRVWLLQLQLPDLIGKGEIYDINQFKKSIFDKHVLLLIKKFITFFNT